MTMATRLPDLRPLAVQLRERCRGSGDIALAFQRQREEMYRQADPLARLIEHDRQQREKFLRAGRLFSPPPD
jgi:hypothetical protein